MSREKEELINKKIKYYMIDNNLNQQGLADKLGISRQWLSVILNYKARVPQELLELINNKGERK